MKKDLTEKQKDFFEKLKNTYSTKALPSYEKIKNEFGYKSKNSIKQYIEKLKDNGFLVYEDENFYIAPELLGAKFVSSYVKAGFASIMDDKIEKRISLDLLLDINSPSTFIFKVSGDSMVDVGIFEGDYVVIKKTSNANLGDIVLAIVDNEFTLKTYKKDEKGPYLQPENKNYPKIRPKSSLSIFGVAIGITRKIG